ncbi:MAG: hypothetical protein IKO66_08965 [Paludibacteraceae bacterium]|nr:hypothetical protein [Paludibacteraceae bacterium]
MKVEFMPGIASMSGSVKTKNGDRLVFMHRASDGKGHGRAYLRTSKDYQRSTPVSEKEIAARALFQNRAQLVKQLMTERRCKTKAEAWKIAKEQIK